MNAAKTADRSSDSGALDSSLPPLSKVPRVGSVRHEFGGQVQRGCSVSADPIQPGDGSFSLAEPGAFQISAEARAGTPGVPGMPWHFTFITTEISTKPQAQAARAASSAASSTTLMASIPPLGVALPRRHRPRRRVPGGDPPVPCTRPDSTLGARPLDLDAPPTVARQFQQQVQFHPGGGAIENWPGFDRGRPARGSR